jgi:hypothetical protein
MILLPHSAYFIKDLGEKLSFSLDFRSSSSVRKEYRKGLSMFVWLSPFSNEVGKPHDP